jgi:hypothetical protein
VSLPPCGSLDSSERCGLVVGLLELALDCVEDERPLELVAELGIVAVLDEDEAEVVPPPTGSLVEAASPQAISEHEVARLK